MSLKPPVFIVGAPRCGTSILYRALQLHSSFKPGLCTNPAGVDLTESYIFQEFSAPEKSNARAYCLDNEREYREFLLATRSIRLLHRFLPVRWIVRSTTKWKPAAAIAWKLSGGDFVARSFFEHAIRARGAVRILEKTPVSILCVERIRTSFPDARMLFLQRHPVNAYASYRKRLRIATALNEKDTEWLKVTPASFCDTYERMVNIAAAESRRTPAQFLRLNYEFLTADPSASIRAVLEFLDEPFESQCIPVDQTHLQDFPIDSHLFGRIVVNDRVRQDLVTEEESGYILHRLAGTIRDLQGVRRPSSGGRL